MVQSIMTSSRPDALQLLASGDLQIDFRKSKPKLEPPFVVYMYCTNKRHFVDKHHIFSYPENPLWLTENMQVKTSVGLVDGNCRILNGTVIGYYVCDKIYTGADLEYLNNILTVPNAPSGDNSDIYGWHVSNLILYAEPRTIEEFSLVDKQAVKHCEFRDQVYNNPDYTNGALLKGGFVCRKDGELDWCNKCKLIPMNKPPRSWRYVYEILEV